MVIRDDWKISVKVVPSFPILFLRDHQVPPFGSYNFVAMDTMLVGGGDDYLQIVLPPKTGKTGL